MKIFTIFFYGVLRRLLSTTRWLTSCKLQMFVTRYLPAVASTKIKVMTSSFKMLQRTLVKMVDTNAGMERNVCLNSQHLLQTCHMETSSHHHLPIFMNAAVLNILKDGFVKIDVSESFSTYNLQTLKCKLLVELTTECHCICYFRSTSTVSKRQSQEREEK